MSILRLPWGDGPLRENELDALTTVKKMRVVGGKLTVVLDNVVENEVFSIRIAPEGTLAREEEAAAGKHVRREASEKASKGVPLKHVVFREGFESDFKSGETILGKRGWTHDENETSTLWVYRGEVAHSGSWYGKLTANSWGTHHVFHRILAKNEGTLEATAWFRFSEYEGNRNGKGKAGVNIGLYETNKRQDKNFLNFIFGTNEQTGLAHVTLNNNGQETIDWRDVSGLREDVRGKWYQVGLVLDFESKRIIARHRPSAEAQWKVFYTKEDMQIDWAPGYLHISGYNQQPDWGLCVDDIEVRSSVETEKDAE